MLSGLTGSLLSHYFVEHVVGEEFAGRLGEPSAGLAHQRVSRLWRENAAQLGPASSARALWDQTAAPLVEILGFAVQRVDSSQQDTRCTLLTTGGTRLSLLVCCWEISLDTLWRNAVRMGIGLDTPWCLCSNGHELRLVDTVRTYSRAYSQFDLSRLADDPNLFAAFWAVMRAEAFQCAGAGTSLVLQVIKASTRHSHAVARSLRAGVVEALQQLLNGLLDARLCGRRRPPSQDELVNGFDESLTVVYRMLFLMFAEARGLVPTWHPVYRDRYTIESLRGYAEKPEPVRGFWEALQAIARLVHGGCSAGTLVVPAFNSRLFSPDRAPMAESCALDDEAARRALRALSNTTLGAHARRAPAPSRARIDYRDLGVEQLGAVYESVLDYVPAVGTGSPGTPRAQLRKGGRRRKSTGSFYTPQSITDYVVRRTLHPLVAHESSERILRLRILDPSMGSAAFLVSACRYLARACERALIEEGACRERDLDEHDRAGLRRKIAQRCLFGVDLNPAAVQLSRLSLWLATLARGMPLTFLDHHLACGDSLIGASPIDVLRQPPQPSGGRYIRARPNADTPLFADLELESSMAHVVAERRWLAETTDDTADVVREKEARLERLTTTAGWKSAADLWCASWMWPEPGTAPDQNIFASLVDELTRGRRVLPAAIAGRLRARAHDIARSRRFFHWILEFPEAFFDQRGELLANGGFDAVVGNPPWDVLRIEGDDSNPTARRDMALTKRFVCASGIYRHQGRGHISRYQLFVERALMLTKNGGRIGLVLPSGVSTDHSASSLRHRLLHHCDMDSLTGFENRQAIFPIHRSVRFVVCTATQGRPTHRIQCRFGITDPGLLETIPDSGDRPGEPAYRVSLTPSLIEALAGRRLAIPSLRDAGDLAIAERIARRFPRLSDSDGWATRFGRELNATEDRRHFHAGGRGLPVLEGKHIDPFVVHTGRSTQRISLRAAAHLLPSRPFLRARLAYRDVASATNRLSLIAAILPAGVVSTHSLFCLKAPLSLEQQSCLCGLLNSFVANYLVRQVMTTHLGSTTVEELRVPRPPDGSPLYEEIVDLVRCSSTTQSAVDRARLQALAARLFGLSPDEFEHVLSTFPLVSERERGAALEALRGL